MLMLSQICGTWVSRRPWKPHTHTRFSLVLSFCLKCRSALPYANNRAGLRLCGLPWIQPHVLHGRCFLKASRPIGSIRAVSVVPGPKPDSGTHLPGQYHAQGSGSFSPRWVFCPPLRSGIVNDVRFSWAWPGNLSGFE